MELDNSYWHTIRKGAMSGALIGWLYFLRYFIYAIGFFFAALIMHQQGNEKVTVGDILIVGAL